MSFVCDSCQFDTVIRDLVCCGEQKLCLVCKRDDLERDPYRLSVSWQITKSNLNNARIQRARRLYNQNHWFVDWFGIDNLPEYFSEYFRRPLVPIGKVTPTKLYGSLTQLGFPLNSELTDDGALLGSFGGLTDQLIYFCAFGPCVRLVTIKRSGSTIVKQVEDFPIPCTGSPVEWQSFTSSPNGRHYLLVSAQASYEFRDRSVKKLDDGKFYLYNPNCQLYSLSTSSKPNGLLSIGPRDLLIGEDVTWVGAIGDLVMIKTESRYFLYDPIQDVISELVEPTMEGNTRIGLSISYRGPAFQIDGKLWECPRP